MRVKYSFVMEYRDKDLDQWVLNTLPVFPNYHFNPKLNIAAGNLPYTMLPQLPYNEYLASTLAPLNVNIPLATDELSYPEDMDDLSLRFLDNNYTYCGALYPKQMKKFKKIYPDVVLNLELFVPPEQAEAYKKKGDLPTIGFKSSTGLPSIYELIFVDYPLVNLAPVVDYFYTKVEHTLTASYIKYVNDPFTDTRLIYNVSVL